MRYFRAWLLALIAMHAISAQAQTKLNFPRILALSDLPTTSLALVNTGPSSASTTFNCFAAGGNSSAQSVQNVPAKGQVARLASEVLVNAKAACWVQILAPITFTVKDPRGQTLLSTTLTIPLSSSDRGFISVIHSNALNGDYTITFSLSYQGVNLSRSTLYQVSGGTTTPTVGQETPIPFSISSNLQYAFRPGDTVRFLIASANFTNQTATGTLNYQLTGPGAFAAGSGSLNVTIPTGLGADHVSGQQ